MAAISSFPYDSSYLPKSERDTLKILEKVGETIHKIWEKQVDSKTGVPSFYPEDLSREELMVAAKRNSKLLSPYTIVKREKNRRLIAVNYKDEYKKEHDRIFELLILASKTTKEKRLSWYLSRIAGYFSKGDFDSIMNTFLSTQNTTIDILIGPIESYNDSFMGVKKSYQYSLRVLRTQETQEVEEMTKIVGKLGILKPSRSVAAKLNTSKIKIRVDDVLMFAGRQAGSMPSSTNLPNEPEKVSKYGTKIVVYHNALVKKFETQLKGYLKHVKKFDPKRTKDSMSQANYRLIILHEIAEGAIKFKGMENRLGEYIDVVRELNADVFGVRSAKYHVLNGLISIEQYNELLIAFLVFAINVCHKAKKEPSIMVYARGFHLAFNYFVKSKSVQFSANTMTVDFAKLSVDLDVLSNMIVALLESGTSDDARKLFEKWENPSIVEKMPKVGK
ncbi:hypothetical protein HYV12_03670 [Candidatus Dojkabacteria bacterium]|nr:hypothetical protein [Candidatus Dojkabacteria bacterium]